MVILRRTDTKTRNSIMRDQKGGEGMKNRYQVYVGNIGMVHECSNKKNALSNYAYYLRSSKHPYGRGSGEDVSLFCNGEPLKEYTGKINQVCGIKKGVSL